MYRNTVVRIHSKRIHFKKKKKNKKKVPGRALPGIGVQKGKKCPVRTYSRAYPESARFFNRYEYRVRGDLHYVAASLRIVEE